MELLPRDHVLEYVPTHNAPKQLSESQLDSLLATDFGGFVPWTDDDHDDRTTDAWMLSLYQAAAVPSSRKRSRSVCD